MSRAVLILDDDEDLRVTLAELMTTACKADCVSVADVESLIESGPRALGCQLAILDINLGVGRKSGLDAQAWLTEQGFAGRIVMLTGHATTHPLVKQAMAVGTAQIIQKPVNAAKLCDLLRGIDP